MKDLISLEIIEKKIFLIRGHRVMLDSDLAELYEVTTGNFNKAVSRNLDSFPPDFMFQLTEKEYKSLRFQIGILKRGSHSKYLPHVFMEQGVSMLSSVLKSKRARLVNIQIMRAFVKLRELLNTHKDLARKLDELETKYDAQFKSVFDAIKMLMPANGLPAPDWTAEARKAVEAETASGPDLSAEYREYYRAVAALVNSALTKAEKIDSCWTVLAGFDPYNIRSSGNNLSHPGFIMCGEKNSKPACSVGPYSTAMKGPTRKIEAVYKVKG